MSGADDAFFEWSGASAPDQGLLSDYRRELHIRYNPHGPIGTGAVGDDLAVLGDLQLLAEDKTYLRGFLSGLQLPAHIQQGLLLEYRQRWEAAAQRANNPNQATNNGRRSANIWIQQGAKGFVGWK